MNGSNGIQEFAMVVHVSPASQQAAWERIVRAARPERGMRATVQTPSLILFNIDESMEFVAIDRADKWLQSLAQSARPAITITTNAQPSHEV